MIGFPNLEDGFVSAFRFLVNEFLKFASGFLCTFSTMFGKDTSSSFLGSFSCTS